MCADFWSMGKKGISDHIITWRALAPRKSTPLDHHKNSVHVKFNGISMDVSYLIRLKWNNIDNFGFTGRRRRRRQHSLLFIHRNFGIQIPFFIFPSEYFFLLCCETQYLPSFKRIREKMLEFFPNVLRRK